MGALLLRWVESATIVHLVYLSMSIFSVEALHQRYHLGGATPPPPDPEFGMFAALFCAPGASLPRLVSFPGFSLWFHAVFHRLHSSRIKYTKCTGRLRLFSASIKLVPLPAICKRLLPPVPVAQHNCRFSVDAFM